MKTGPFRVARADFFNRCVSSSSFAVAAFNVGAFARARSAARRLARVTVVRPGLPPSDGAEGDPPPLAPARRAEWLRHERGVRKVPDYFAWRTVAGIIFALFFIGHARAAESDVIARVGGVTVRSDELRASLAGLDPREQAALAHDPALLSQTVRTLLVQRMILNEAHDKLWDQQPEVVAKLERVRQTTLLESYLLSVSQPPADFPRGDELRAAYEANRAAYQVPRQFRLAQIFIASPKGAEKSVVDKAETKLATVQKKLEARDADFAAVASADSEEPESASRGGEIGWLTEAQIQADLRPRVIGLTPGGISEPRQLSDGWHILKLLEVREAHVASLEEVRQPLTQQMRAERARANAQAYVARLAKETPITLNELALPELLSKTAN